MPGRIWRCLAACALVGLTTFVDSGAAQAGGRSADFDALHFTSGRSAAAALAPELQTGTLLFSQGDCAAVKIFTKSRYTHVAVVVKESNGCFVYDSMSGVGVRKLSLAQYCAAECPNTLRVCQPKTRFTKKRAARLREHLDSELGREYSVTHHLTGKRADGVHCSEYATDALCACQLMKAKNPPRVSPASLRLGVLESGVYTETAEVQLVEPIPQAPADASCCSRCWFDTKQCTKRFFKKIGRVVFCR